MVKLIKTNVKNVKNVNSESKLKVKDVSLDNYLNNKLKLIFTTVNENKTIILVGAVYASYKLLNIYYY